MTLGTFTDANMRENIEYRIGKSVTAGSTVVLSELYAQLADSSISFSNVSWQAYNMKDGSPDFSSPVDISGTYTMDAEIAVLFTANVNGENRCTLVELVFSQEPQISVNSGGYTLDTDRGNTYVYGGELTVGDEVEYPDVTYKWGCSSGAITGSYFDTEISYGSSGLNVVKAAYYTIDSNGVYCLHKIERNTLTFTLGYEYLLLVYELNNVYGESYFIYFEYSAEQVVSSTYTVTSLGGDICASGDIAADDDGVEQPISASAQGLITSDNYHSLLTEEYYLNTDTNSLQLVLTSYAIYTDSVTKKQTASGMTEALAENLWNEISASGYCVLVLNYTRGDNVFMVTYLANVNFSGSKNYTAFDYSAYFTDYEYNFTRPYVYGVNGDRLSQVTVSVSKYSSVNSDELVTPTVAKRSYSLSLSGKQYYLTFSSTGKFMLSYTFTITLSDITIKYTLTQDIYVYDGQGEVTITYVTDGAHPFSEEIMTSATEYQFADGAAGYAYTVTYSLLKAITTLSGSSFAVSGDVLFGWSMTENGAASASSVVISGNAISNFITKFNEQSPCLYAIWDEGLTITAVANDVITSRTYYLSLNGTYVISFSDFQAIAPSGYSFVGWTGGFLDTEIVSTSYTIYNVSSNAAEDYYTIYAEFREKIVVTYVINSAYSSSYFRNETVLDGYYIETARTAVAKEGYTFVGWYLATDYDTDGNVSAISGEQFNVKTTPVDAAYANAVTSTSDGDMNTIKLVAVFTDSEGKFVW